MRLLVADRVDQDKKTESTTEREREKKHCYFHLGRQHCAITIPLLLWKILESKTPLPTVPELCPSNYVEAV